MPRPVRSALFSFVFFVVDRLVLLIMVASITTAMILMVIRASDMWTLKSNLSMIFMQCYLSNYDREGYSISCKHEEKVAYYISMLVDIGFVQARSRPRAGGPKVDRIRFGRKVSVGRFIRGRVEERSTFVQTHERAFTGLHP